MNVRARASHRFTSLGHGWLRNSLCLAIVTLVGVTGQAATLSGQAVDLRRGVEEIAAQLLERVPPGDPLTVAVANFPDLRGNVSDLGRFIAERLTTELSLASDRVRVIERRRLVNVIEELKLNMSELVDPDQVRQLGQMVGAEALVTGSISDLGNEVDVDARLVMIESNEVLPGASTRIARDQVVSDLMERGVTPTTAGGAGRGPAATRPETVTRFTHRRMEVEAIGADWRDGDVEVHFFFRNKEDRRMSVTLRVDSNRSYAIDDTGLRHALSQPTYNTTVDFGPQIRERSSVIFGGFDRQPKTLTVVLQMWLGGGPGDAGEVDVTLREIPVTG